MCMLCGGRNSVDVIKVTNQLTSASRDHAGLHSRPQYYHYIISCIQMCVISKLGNLLGMNWVIGNKYYDISRQCCTNGLMKNIHLDESVLKQFHFLWHVLLIIIVHKSNKCICYIKNQASLKKKRLLFGECVCVCICVYMCVCVICCS
jgi:hypothetical protein